MVAERPALITRVGLKNYQSIVACDVGLGPLCVLVGPNGSGKSNFLDALRFVSDALADGLDRAIRVRGGVRDILAWSTPPDAPVVQVELDLILPSGARGHYGFDLAAKPSNDFEVIRETCTVSGSPDPALDAHYTVTQGGSIGSWNAGGMLVELAPARVRDRLYLVNASGLPQFRPVYDGLSRMAFYSLNPIEMRKPAKPDPGMVLTSDGGNIAGVLRQLAERDPATQQRVAEYLAAVTPGIRDVRTVVSSGFETLAFRQRFKSWHDAQVFHPNQASHGTLRALGVLVALFQSRMGGDSTLSLVGIEGPENDLHPAAAGVLLDALREASESTQVLVTSHSPALLDNDEIDIGIIRAVIADEGRTIIGPVDAASREVLEKHLYTAGELLRIDQLKPEREPVDGRSIATTAVSRG